MNKKIAIYIRVSTHMQVEKGVSLDAQEQQLIQYCIDNCYDYVIYKDKGISAKNTNRPQLQQLLSDIKTKQYDTVLVWKLSRLSRSIRDFSNLIYFFNKYDTAFMSFSEKIDTRDVSGKLLMYVLSIVSEIERDNISENITLAKRYVFEHKNDHLCTCIYGYDIKNGLLVVNPVERDIILKIFNMYIEYKNLSKVAQILNDAKIKGKRGGNFACQTIKRIITNKAYLGYNKYKHNIKPGKHAPIISLELYQKANDIYKGYMI